MTFQTPCIHRIHIGEPTGALAIHHSIGMSIECDALIDRLDKLNQYQAQQREKSSIQLVTFDDGWADVISLAPHFDAFKHLQPVLFLTSAQCMGDQGLLPLPRLYEWQATKEKSRGVTAELPINRFRLKLLPEEVQHTELDRLGVNKVNSSSQVLSTHQVHKLIDQGWLVGSHGADHHDLRQAGHQSLKRILHKAYAALEIINGVPWLAWPEGRCNQRICDVAASVGFELQFSLGVESGSVQRKDLIHREIWK